MRVVFGITALVLIALMSLAKATDGETRRDREAEARAYHAVTTERREAREAAVITRAIRDAR